MALYAGLEMGGTKTIAVLGTPGDIRARATFATTTPQETLGRAADIISRWQAKHQIAGLGIGSFGPVRIAPEAADYGTVLDTPKPGWARWPVIATLAQIFAGPIALDTDVNAAGLAEHALGHGQGCSSLVYLTLGTGVGGGVLIDGKPVHGALHPEIGHMRLRRAPGDTFPGSCPFHGDCVEGLISGPALEARFGCSPAMVLPDDPRWDPIASDLAELLATLLLALSPERIVVGGGVTMRQPVLLGSAIARVPARLAGYLGAIDTAQLRTRIVLPRLGNDAGPQGTLCLAQRVAALSA